MNTSLVHAILTMFVMAYVYAAWIFLLQQRRGESFIASCDKAMVRGGLFFAAGSVLSFIAVTYGNFAPVFI